MIETNSTLLVFGLIAIDFKILLKSRRIIFLQRTKRKSLAKQKRKLFFVILALIILVLDHSLNHAIFVTRNQFLLIRLWENALKKIAEIFSTKKWKEVWVLQKEPQLKKSLKMIQVKEINGWKVEYNRIKGQTSNKIVKHSQTLVILIKTASTTLNLTLIINKNLYSWLNQFSILQSNLP